MSAWLHLFVVYGRIARCLVPFLALAAAPAFAALSGLGRGGRIVSRVLAGTLVAIAAIRFATPLRQWFADPFIARGQIMAARRPAERIRVINAYSLLQPVFIDTLSYADTLFARPNPVAYEPFLFEHLGPAGRNEYRAHDLTMRIVRLHAHALGEVDVTRSPFAPYPGPLQLTVRLPTRDGRYSPLIATGTNVLEISSMFAVWPQTSFRSRQSTGATRGWSLRSSSSTNRAYT